jgi:hypothetical protein
VLIAGGREDEALKLTQQALKLSAPSDDALRLELLIYSYAHDIAGRDTAWPPLKVALTQGVRTSDWSFAITLEQARKTSHPDMPLLHDLTRVANGEAEITILDKHAAWRSA